VLSLSKHTASPLARDLSAGGAALLVLSLSKQTWISATSGRPALSWTCVEPVETIVHGGPGGKRRPPGLEHAPCVEPVETSEANLRGFNVYRSTNPLSYGKQINAVEIPASAPPGGGAPYSLLDPDQGTGGPLYYWLEAILYSDPAHPVWFGPVVPTRVGVAYLPLIQCH
jgi:hypothetical protein